MIKIEFPAHRTDIAHAIGKALCGLTDEAINPGILAGSAAIGALQPAPEVPVSAASEETTPEPNVEETAVADVVASEPVEERPTVDEFGVEFDEEYCGKAKNPFYDSGARKGQWKKRKGVSDTRYNDWHAHMREDGTETDTAAAFGAKSESEPAEPIPTTCGEFMGWASAKQAAGLLTQDDIGRAYQQAGWVVTDLFPPADDDTVAARVGILYNILASQAGA